MFRCQLARQPNANRTPQFSFYAHHRAGDFIYILKPIDSFPGHVKLVLLQRTVGSD
jgi:hypothetical protein